MKIVAVVFEGKIIGANKVALVGEAIERTDSVMMLSNGMAKPIHLTKFYSVEKEEKRRAKYEEEISSGSYCLNRQLVKREGVTYKNYKYFNFTPHAINVQIGEKTIVFPPCGMIARVKTSQEEVTGMLRGMPVVKTSFGEVEGIILRNSPREIAIVSAMVLSAMKEQNHPLLDRVVAPNTGAAIRNEKGHIIAVPGFTI